VLSRAAAVLVLVIESGLNHRGNHSTINDAGFNDEGRQRLAISLIRCGAEPG